MKINILTIFPDLFFNVLNTSLLGTALKNNIWSLNVINIKDFANNKHKSIDDKIYGGGAGMLFQPDILQKAIEFHSCQKTKIIHMSPKGPLFTQTKAKSLANIEELTIIASRFEGVDQRLIEKYKIEEISIGDYILTGGEVPALVIIETIIRLLSGTIGNKESLTDESFEKNLLEHNQFTKPQIFDNMPVPEVLLSGNHALIKKFRLMNAIENTRFSRTDLWFKFIKQSLDCKDEL